MTRLRNMIANNWDYLGAYDVGLPAEDIPEGSLLSYSAIVYSSNLLRVYCDSILPGVTIEEDGSYTGERPDDNSLTLYVDGVITAFPEQTPISKTYQATGGGGGRSASWTPQDNEIKRGDEYRQNRAAGFLNRALWK